LVLVFALNLQDIEKVGRRGVDLDQILVIPGHRIWQIGDLELFGSLDIFFDLNASHGESIRLTN